MKEKSTIEWMESCYEACQGLKDPKADIEALIEALELLWEDSPCYGAGEGRTHEMVTKALRPFKERTK